GEQIEVLDSIAHPSYVLGSPEHDIGLIRLRKAVSVPPLSIRRHGFDATVVGAPLIVVGFGRQSAADTDALEKRMGFARLAQFTDHTLTLAADPALTCFGDSGGPALLQDGATQSVAGVTSGGDQHCAQWGIETRVDQHLDFICAYTAAGTAQLGA